MPTTAYRCVSCSLRARLAHRLAWLHLLVQVTAVTAVAESLSLHDAVEAAQNSPQARIAAAQTEEVRGQLRQAALGPNPRLFLQSEDWRPWGSDFDFGSQTENYAFLSQTLETSGKRGKRIAAGRARLAQAEAEEQAVRLNLVTRVAGAYSQAVVLRRITLLLEDDMQAVDKMVLYDQQRVDAGAMRGVDLLRMKVERDRLLLALRTAQREATQGQLELLKQMGSAPSTERLELTDPVDSIRPIAPMPVEQVLAQRPDLQVHREAVKLAEADLAVQRAARVPNLDLIGGYKRNNTFNTGYSALQIDLPFRNRNQGEIDRGEAAVRLARSSLEATELRVRGEVAQSEESYRQQRDIVEHTLPEMRANAQQNLSLLTEAYRIGGVDLLRFLDAERTAFDVEVSALRTLLEYRQSALRLQLSYGEQP